MWGERKGEDIPHLEKKILKKCASYFPPSSALARFTQEVKMAKMRFKKTKIGEKYTKYFYL